MLVAHLVRAMRKELFAESAPNDRATDLSIKTHVSWLELELDEMLAYAFASRCIDSTLAGVATGQAAPRGDQAKC